MSVEQINFICCEEVGFEGRFGKQQVINEGTATRSMKPANIMRVCINLNR